MPECSNDLSLVNYQNKGYDSNAEKSVRRNYTGKIFLSGNIERQFYIDRGPKEHVAAEIAGQLIFRKQQTRFTGQGGTKMEDVRKQIGRKVRLYRRIKGLTAEELAEAIHKTKSTVSKYENGEIVMDIEVLTEIARVLEVEISQLFDFSVLEKKASAPPRGILSGEEIFLYFYDGRSGKVASSLIRVNAAADGATAVMYYVVPSLSSPEDCRALYYGSVEYHDILTRFSLINQSNALEAVSIYAMNTMENRATTYGLMLGISTYPLYPVVIKCLFSGSPLPVNEELREKLLISREDIRMTRALNMFSVCPI